MNTEDIKLEAIAVHQIGDKSLKEPLVLSRALLQLSDDQISQLKSFFLDHFKGQEFYNFRLIDGEVNPSRLPHIVETVFEDPESIHSQSCEVARMLYSFTESETLNDGLLYMCHLKDVRIEDEMVNALGIYFCPLDDSFLTVHDLDSQPQLHFSFGTYLGKHEMAALIYNADREIGYKIDIIDKSKKTREGQVWTEHFLKTKPAEDDFFRTSQVMGLTKSFVEHQLPSEFEIEKKDQLEYLDKSINYFKNQDHYSQQEFANEIFADSNIAESFDHYRNQYQEDNGVKIEPEFDLNEYAVKKQARIFKSVLKLDRNFHIYIHGDRSLIERDVDEMGRKFYKLYYEKET